MQRRRQGHFYIWSLSWRQWAVSFIELGYLERKAFGTKDVETRRSGPDMFGKKSAEFTRERFGGRLGGTMVGDVHVTQKLRRSYLGNNKNTGNV